jgi:hypothetical protein
MRSEIGPTALRDTATAARPFQRSTETADSAFLARNPPASARRNRFG